ncbi:MAG: retropepsin-like aspartic protease [Clostridium sp.]
MVNLEMKYGLPFCSIEIIHNNKSKVINNVLIDTGSGGTVFKMDIVEEIDITIEPTDTIETIQGVGGCEFVYKKNIEKIKLRDLEVDNFEAEIGVMDYGFDINGIIGIDFLVKINAIIDLYKMVIKISKVEA